MVFYRVCQRYTPAPNKETAVIAFPLWIIYTDKISINDTQEDYSMERAFMALSAIALVAGIVLFSEVAVGAAIVFALWSRIAQANRQQQEMQIQMHKGGKLD